MNDAVETPATEKKSIIPPKYQGKYKGAEDWLSQFIDGQVKAVAMKDKTVKETVDGEEVTKTIQVASGPAKLDLDKLFALCKANSIDTADMEAQRDRKNAPGRIRMTLGNSLRAEARHRHGLNAIDGEFVEAPAEFIGDHAKTKNPDGSKIVVAKAEPAKEDVAAE